MVTQPIVSGSCSEAEHHCAEGKTEPPYGTQNQKGGLGSKHSLRLITDQSAESVSPSRRPGDRHGRGDGNVRARG